MLIGSHCEIVLHSLQDLKCSAIRIANGEHTGRQIGSPITDLALRMLHDMTGADSSVSKCYFTRAKSGVLMKSVTIAIRNRDHRVIGLLCINMNLDVPFFPDHEHLYSARNAGGQLTGELCFPRLTIWSRRRWNSPLKR